MTADRRDILEQVARGDLSPEQADEILRDLDREASPTMPEERINQPDIRLVKISVGVGGIDVRGDPSVAQAEVDGPHQAELDGDTIVVRGELDADDLHGFVFRGRRRKIRIGPGGGSYGDTHVSRLKIRVNPSIAIEARLDAGPLSISGMTGPIKARVAAGPVTIEGFEGPLDVSVNAGAVRAIGKLTHGESRIRSDVGAVRVELDPTSSVDIIADAALGKVVVLGDDRPKSGRFSGDRREARIGAGAAILRVETAMGTVHVSSR